MDGTAQNIFCSKSKAELGQNTSQAERFKNKTSHLFCDMLDMSREIEQEVEEE